jgi:hypothetical protein
MGVIMNHHPVAFFHGKTSCLVSNFIWPNFTLRIDVIGHGASSLAQDAALH